MRNGEAVSLAWQPELEANPTSRELLARLQADDSDVAQFPGLAVPQKMRRQEKEQKKRRSRTRSERLPRPQKMRRQEKEQARSRRKRSSPASASQPSRSRQEVPPPGHPVRVVRVPRD